MMITTRMSRTAAGGCQMKVFNSDNGLSTMRVCSSPKVGYTDIVTSTNNPKMSSKMKYSEYIRTGRCVPSTLHVR